MPQTYKSPVYGLSNKLGEPILDGDGNRVKFYAPQALVPPLSQAGGFVTPLAAVVLSSWRAYTGQFGAPSSDCGTVASGSPIWVPESSNTTGQYTFTIEPPVAGVAYSMVVPFIAIIPAAGKTVTDIQMDAHPYLTLQYDTPTSRKIVGNVPAGATSLTVTLIAIQNDGKQARKAFTKAAVTQQIRLYGRYNVNTATWTLNVGPYGEGTPKIQILNGPEKWSDKAVWNMTPTQTINLPNQTGQSYSYQMQYVNLISGYYDLKVDWLGQVRYAQIILIEEESQVGEIPLVTTQPNAPENIGPLFEGTEEINTASVDKLGYAWQFNNPSAGQPSVLYLYAGLTGGPFEYAVDVNYDGPAKTPYTQMNIGASSGGYTHNTSVYGAPATSVVTLYVRLVGTTTDLIVKTFTLPSSGTVAKTQIYP